MKVRYILFKGAMVRAILDGSKRVTRRLVTSGKCRYGEAGDILGVKETYAILWKTEAGCACDSDIAPDDWLIRSGELPYTPPEERDPITGLCDHVEIEYRASSSYGIDPEVPGGWCVEDARDRRRSGEAVPTWQPSIFMPARLIRVWLRVEDVRSEPLDRMTEEEALLEGFKPCPISGRSALQEFHRLWDEINGKKSPVDANPLVWRVSFDPTERPVLGGGA